MTVTVEVCLNIFILENETYHSFWSVVSYNTAVGFYGR